MASSLLDHLLARIVDSGLLDDPVAENGLVYGRATIDAAGAVVTVNVDPELEDDEETLDDDTLLAAIARILSVSETRWRAVIDEVADDIDEAVDDEPVLEQIDLRDDLEATSVVVFADAVLIAFDAPKQFPDSRILVQLDDELEVANIEVRDREGAEAEVIEFDDLDGLLERLSGDDR
ncbi:cytochrome C5 [Microbacterium sp. NPDC088619]|uniref:cytochrome C5 n=1 Tax=Microbacterium sp. NPDC088619 TaxID=3364196 RepID=UPI0038183496